ncbi:hypothetical protein C4573_01490 [Candidatus Woesearchaeota archaeon]|nr:MAG: hypothetical protein C4573_01490 [Candidatus Woesearchaeota archaeon]
MRKIKKQREVLLKVLAVILALFIFSVFLEIFVRVANLAPEKGLPPYMNILDNDTGFKLNPGFTGIVRDAEYTNNINISSQGHRDREFNYSKPEGTLRILALGDSMQFGTGVEEEETYIKTFERELSKTYTVEVINAGVGGWSTKQELAYLKTEGIKFQPDVILLSYYVGNDLEENYYYKNKTYSIIGGYLIEQRPSAIVKANWLIYRYCKSCLFTVRAVRNIAYTSSLSEAEKRSLEIEQFIPEETEKKSAAWNETIETLIAFKAFAKEHDATFIVLILPHKLQVDSQVRNSIPVQNLDPLLPNKVLKNISGIECLDSLDYNFSSSDYYFKIDGHINKKGHQAIANILTDYFINYKIISEKYQRPWEKTKE